LASLSELLNKRKLILMDCAMGTELQRRGVDISGPLWSARANIYKPDVVRHIHMDNIDTGADIITTNTFRTQARTFERANYHYNGMDFKESAREITRIAVDIAQDAVLIAGEDNVLIAGCISPIEDCYRPDLVPEDMDALCTEHWEHIQNLIAGGLDFLLAETMISIREISAVLNQLHKCGKEYAISLLCRNENELFSGELLKDAMSIIEKYSPQAVMLNCIHPAQVEPILAHLKKLTDKPLGVYANIGNPNVKEGIIDKTVSPDEYLHYAKKWRDKGVRIIGGCCGTTPMYINKLNSIKK
jgi:S-methylmethionine-dependent homocysteine/selenocysteine methylase